MDMRAEQVQYNPYRVFTREQWAKLRDDTPMTLEANEISALRSMHDRLDLKDTLLLGHSFGGWVALEWARRWPGENIWKLRKPR